jgi:hypothetical protein
MIPEYVGIFLIHQSESRKPQAWNTLFSNVDLVARGVGILVGTFLSREAARLLVFLNRIRINPMCMCVLSFLSTVINFYQ